jgi:hypothetical protein
MSQAIPKSIQRAAVSVSKNAYRRRHGAFPTGFGRWRFLAVARDLDSAQATESALQYAGAWEISIVDTIAAGDERLALNHGAWAVSFLPSFAQQSAPRALQMAAYTAALAGISQIHFMP